MLVLARKSGETIRIGDGVRITVLSVAGGQIRLGIEAPEHIAVLREEVYERIAAENVEAMKASLEALDQGPAKPSASLGESRA